MFGIDNRDILRLSEGLEELSDRALPFAVRQTLNDAAFQTQRIARVDIEREFVLRNNFTKRGVLVETARIAPVRLQEAIVGSTEGYMADQEFGAVRASTGRHGVPIATSYSAGESEDAQPRTRLTRRVNRLSEIRLRRSRSRGVGRKQKNLIQIRQAATSGRKFVFLELAHRKGIFKVVGGSRRPKIKMVHDLTHPSVVIPRRPWLKPAFDEAARMIPAFYADALRFQLNRLNSFS